MSEFDLQKQAQDYYRKVPVIVLGSGASAAHGMSGMGALATHLIDHTDLSEITNVEEVVWNSFYQSLKDGIGLESALHKVDVSPLLTSRIVRATWELINSEDLQVFHKSIEDNAMFPLGKLISHMFKSSLSMVNIVTTNYDRMAEYACDYEKVHHYTGFTHGFYRQLVSPTEIMTRRRVNIWKVHGSLDWFLTPLGETVALTNIFSIPNGYEPQIVTPGTQKYHKTHFEPYRSIINNADSAINSANSYLCVGYGFNDEHIQPKLMVKCIRQKTPLTVVTRSLSESARKLIIEGKMQNYIAIERGASDAQSLVYSSRVDTPLVVEEDIWSLQGYLSLIL